MKVLKVKQGEDQWLAERATRFCSSEAPIMMGASTKASRNDLLRLKATGSEREHSRFALEVLFPRGHEVEAKARPIAEDLIGSDLFPATVVSDDDRLLASLDGMTMDGDIIWECKQWNEAKARAVIDGVVPGEDLWQVVQALVVTRAARCLYTVTDGTPERTATIWFSLRADDEKVLRAGWAQFEEDLGSYVETAPALEAEPEGASPESLPSLLVEVRGEVLKSNLQAFQARATEVIGSINRDLSTDQDFADAEKAVKWCSEIEGRLKAAKHHALAQTESIDVLFSTIDTISAHARETRLALDKLIKARKQEVRREIIHETQAAFRDHLDALELSLSSGDRTVVISMPQPDVADAIKGKKTVKSLRDAADDLLAKAKIEANALAEALRANLKRFDKLTAAHPTLFPDWASLILKSPDDMEAAIKLRITEHEAGERKRIEAERERIRAEEAERLRREQEQPQKPEEKASAPDKPKTPEPETAAPATSAPAPEPEDGLHPLTLALLAWGERNHVSSDAMQELACILETHLDCEILKAIERRTAEHA